MSREQLTIVIPTYNEETRLPPTIKKIIEWANQTPVFEIELIIVDDGSVDRTCDLVREFSKKDSRIRLIEEEHIGAMHAILVGFKAAKYPLVGNMDADIAVHPREFETLLHFVNESSIAQGSRIIGRNRNDSTKPTKSIFRRFISGCMRILFKTLFKDQVEDPQIGFRLFQKQSILKIYPTMRLWHDGLKHGEIAIRAYGLGMTVTEIPVTYIHDEDSRCVPKDPIKAMFITLEALVALISMWAQCSIDYHRGILKRKTTRGAFLFWPFNLFSKQVPKKHN
jgi:glycosyltransferase involved in cell wall biosynthesis